MLKRVFSDLKFLFLGLIFASLILSPLSAFAVEPQQQTQTQQQQQAQPQQQTQTQQQQTQPQNTDTDDNDTSTQKDTCRTEAGSLGWLICPTTGLLAKITDGIYNTIEDLLVVQPLAFASNSPYHQVWSLFRDLTNLVFVGFLLVVIYSQLTGLGLSNYGIKRALPKVIVSAILINLSYVLCALLVDLSNIIGASLRGFFSSLESTITPTGLLAQATSAYDIDYTAVFGYLTGATLLGGLSIASAGGIGTLFLSLLPVLLAAVVAIVIAYVTVAARQAFVFILIMISPLAFVAMILPNTEKWYSTWKKSLSQMLIFYPAFSFLFGACALISWVIIASAESYLFIILGIAIKVIPLISSWSLLKMSGTLPGQVSSLLTKFTRAPLSAASRPLTELAALRRAKYFAENPRPYQNFRRFAQGLEDRKNRRFLDTEAYIKASKIRGAGFAAEITTPEGKLTKRGASLYSASIGNALEAETKIKHRDNIFEQGIEDLAKNPLARRHYKREDARVLSAADSSWMETAHGEWIRSQNAISRRERISRAMSAHEQSALYHRNVDPASLARYRHMSAVTGSNVAATQFLAADAASTAGTQERLIAGKFQQYFASLPPTQHVEDAIKDLTNQGESAKYIEPIISGLRVLNQRGDTDLVKKHLDDALQGGQIRLGTHASQALANFLMFEAKDSDFTLRRFGKYINLETARVFNEGQSPDIHHADGRRRNTALDFNEYVTGHYIDYDDSGQTYIANSKLAMPALLKGTPINNIERTAFKTFDEALKKAYGDDLEGLKKARAESISSLMPAIISAGLSYPSGSEQLVNLASWLTGLKEKNGEWIKTWEDPSSPLYGFSPSDIASVAKSFVSAQTASQFLSIRTDIISPLKELFAQVYEADPSAVNLVDEETPKKLNKLKTEQNNLDAQIATATTDEERTRLQKAKEKIQKQIKNEKGGAVIMDLLDQSGALIQIINTRRSGGTNNSKNAILNMLHADDDVWVTKYKETKQREREAKRAALNDIDLSDPDISDPIVPDHPIYSSQDRANFQTEIANIYDLNRDDPDNFYEQAIDYLRSALGTSSYLVASLERYHAQNPTLSVEELYDLFLTTLANPVNY